jgi:hypothetical protein
MEPTTHVIGWRRRATMKRGTTAVSQGRARAQALAWALSIAALLGPLQLGMAVIVAGRTRPEYDASVTLATESALQLQLDMNEGHHVLHPLRRGQSQIVARLRSIGPTRRQLGRPIAINRTALRPPEAGGRTIVSGRGLTAAGVRAK